MTSTPTAITELETRFHRMRIELPDNRIRDAYRRALREIVEEEFGGPRSVLEEARTREDPFLRILAIDTFE